MNGKEIVKKNIKKIGVFRALQLGDMLCSVPTFRALRTQYPNAQITLIGLAWAKDFATRFSQYITDFIEFPGFPSLPERDVDTKSFPDFLRKIQKEKFDVLLQLHGSGKVTNPLMSLFNAKAIAGYYTKNNFCPSKETFFIYPEKIHEVKKYLKLLNNLGIPSYGVNLEFPITESEKLKAEMLLKQHSLEKKSYVILHPGAREKKKRINTNIFSRILDVLKKNQVKIILTGTQSEYELCNEILNYSRYANSINLAGKTDLGQLGYLVKHAVFVISNDTGISHIAAALQTPSVVLFTHYSNPTQWAPLNNKLHIPILPPHSSHSIKLATNVLLTYYRQEGEIYAR